ncbi:alpha-amylase/subtilisin inhibitor-like isoform X1 [Neltuma alba]|uniref:alpha-amylase/subtilisin inhibitor-like isoform X1 n=1 Tax=Neltuma alba TaxID=207710 RepID=UPI0010A52326|nr:alpha-amylase/subtilisin inhibitor-like isoform X1 [Prosopis alba]
MRMASSSVLCLAIAWLLIMMMAASALSQSDENATVLDTNRRPVQYGLEYYIKPAITDSGGRFTLINRNSSCPSYVGQLNTDVGEGLPVTFMPQAGEDKVVRVNRDFRVAFSAATTCIQSTLWKVGNRDPKSGRRLIVTGRALSRRDYSNFFRFVETQFEGIYNIRWCPTEVCPTCRFDCGFVGGLRENGKILEALDGFVLPVVFEKRT